MLRPQENTPSGSAPRTASPVPASKKRERAWRTGDTPEGKIPCSAWSVADVAEYLGRLALDHIADKFVTNGVDGVNLQDLSEADLVDELGLTKLQARMTKSRLP